MDAVKITFKHNVVKTTQDLSSITDFIVLFRLRVMKKYHVNLLTSVLPPLLANLKEPVGL